MRPPAISTITAAAAPTSHGRHSYVDSVGSDVRIWVLAMVRSSPLGVDSPVQAVPGVSNQDPIVTGGRHCEELLRGCTGNEDTVAVDVTQWDRARRSRDRRRWM
jgi:hypothetical protein